LSTCPVLAPSETSEGGKKRDLGGESESNEYVDLVPSKDRMSVSAHITMEIIAVHFAKFK
jgi:hypothetical protein